MKQPARHMGMCQFTPERGGSILRGLLTPEASDNPLPPTGGTMAYAPIGVGARVLLSADDSRSGGKCGFGFGTGGNSGRVGR
jgi:hypothetical protein